MVSSQSGGRAAAVGVTLDELMPSSFYLSSFPYATMFASLEIARKIWGEFDNLEVCQLPLQFVTRGFFNKVL